MAAPDTNGGMFSNISCIMVGEGDVPLSKFAEQLLEWRTTPSTDCRFLNGTSGTTF